jgi:hypothetical protein
MGDAPSLEALSRQVIVRYRGTGHTRFALPPALCGGLVATLIEESLRSLFGVYRVTLYGSKGKLSVYYDPHACGLHDLVRCLEGALGALNALGSPAARRQGEAPVASVTPKPADRVLGWLEETTGNLKAKAAQWKTSARLVAQLVSAQAGPPGLTSLLSEHSAVSFANDVVVFYLIKHHWESITKRWLKEPLKYRYARLTTFYLVFLLVRFRRQVAKKP